MALIRGPFIPKFLLRGFTLGGEEDNPLFVFDQERRRSWRSTPMNAAKETGMYATNGSDPELMERTMANIEGTFGRIVGDVIRTSKLPTGDDWIEFLGFIAVMIARVPRRRDEYKRMGHLLGSPELYAALTKPGGQQALESALRKCNFPPDAFTVEEVRLLIETEGIDFLRQPNIYLYGMSHNAADLVPVLRQRSWTLWRCASDAPDLICSNNPVAVVPTTQNVKPCEFGLGSPDSLLSLALDRRTAVVGTYGEPLKCIELDRAEVALLNTGTTLLANQVYSPTDGFVWMRKDGGIATAADFLNEAP